MLRAVPYSNTKMAMLIINPTIGVGRREAEPDSDHPEHHR